MGSDSRDGEGNNIDNLTGGGERSDTTIMFHLSADRETAYGISIPRDTLVDRPDCYDKNGDVIPGATDAMWNEAFSVGGPACTMQQFEQLTGIRLDHYVMLDFAGFQDMVDAIDGVEVCIPEDIADPAHGINIPAGTREIQGKEALNYVRARYTLGDGSDIGRIKRQQAFIAAMASKVLARGTLARVDRLVGFLDAATQLAADRHRVAAQDRADRRRVQEHRPRQHQVRHRAVPVLHRPAGPGRDAARGRSAVAAGDRRRAAHPQAAGRRDHRRRRRRRLAQTVPSGPSGDRVAERPREPERRASAKQRGSAHEQEAASTETDEERRRRLAAVFGDVLPDTTADERDPAEGRRNVGGLAQGPGAAAPRVRRRRRLRPGAATAGRGSPGAA